MLTSLDLRYERRAAGSDLCSIFIAAAIGLFLFFLALAVGPAQASDVSDGSVYWFQCEREGGECTRQCVTVNRTYLRKGGDAECFEATFEATFNESDASGHRITYDVVDYDGNDQSELLQRVMHNDCEDVDDGDSFSATFRVELKCSAEGRPGGANVPRLLTFSSGQATCWTGEAGAYWNYYAEEEGSQPYDIELRDWPNASGGGHNHGNRLDLYCRDDVPALGPWALCGLALLLLGAGVVLVARATSSASGSVSPAGRT